MRRILTELAGGLVVAGFALLFLYCLLTPQP